MKRIFIILATVLSIQAMAQTVPTVPSVPTNVKHSRYTNYSSQDKGYWAAAELVSGAGFTTSNYSTVPVELDLINGYRFNEFIKLGLGIGVKYNISDYLKTQRDQAFSLPIFVDVRGNFISNSYRIGVPFWRFDAGYTVFEGATVAPAVGYSFGSGGRHHFTISLGYVMQAVTTKNNTAKNSTLFFNGAQLKIGYEF